MPTNTKAQERQLIDPSKGDKLYLRRDGETCEAKVPSRQGDMRKWR